MSPVDVERIITSAISSPPNTQSVVIFVFVILLALGAAVITVLYPHASFIRLEDRVKTMKTSWRIPHELTTADLRAREEEMNS